MAMGGHHHKGNYAGGGGHRGRPYGLMLLLAFGAALMGVMALHKFRERRVFNIVLKDKDRELYSLNLLLQKERDYAKEMKRNTEEMKSKLYALRTQKMELDSRIQEMQSTISSLKDEHRTMEFALEEKQEEIKMLHEKEMDLGKGDSQESSLAEVIKQKDIEIEDLKRRLESQVRIWSVSTDDPSIQLLNMSKNGSEMQEDAAIITKDSTENSTSEEKDEPVIINIKETKENSTSEEGSETRMVDGKTTTNVEETEKLLGASSGSEPTIKEKLPDQGNTTTDESQTRGLKMDRLNATNVEERKNTEIFEARDVNGDRRAADAEGKTEVRKLEEGEKLEQTQISSDSSGFDSPGIPLARRKGRKWRVIARNRKLEGVRTSGTSEAATVKHRGSSEEGRLQTEVHRRGTRKHEDHNKPLNLLDARDERNHGTGKELQKHIYQHVGEASENKSREGNAENVIKDTKRVGVRDESHDEEASEADVLDSQHERNNERTRSNSFLEEGSEEEEEGEADREEKDESEF